MFKRLVTLSGAAVSVAALFVASAGAMPTNTTKIITANDLDNTSSNPAVVATDGLNKWFMYNDTTDTIDNTLGSFVYGPATPPHGNGSVAFTLGASPLDRKNIATYQFGGQALSTLTKLSYTAYSHSGVAGTNESPYLNFNVDFTGTSTTWQKRLVYVPSANMVSVPQDTWNTYDAISSGNALWNWSGFAANGNKWPDGNINQNRTWSDILTAFPSARVLPGDSWLGVRVGEPGPTGYTGNVDSFTLGTANKVTTYDFEPTNLPNNEKDCRNNGWKAFNAPTFSSKKACENWVDAAAHGNIRMSGPSQKIKFNVANTKDNDRDHHDRDERGRKNTVEYWNFDYPGGLHYKAAITCQNVNPLTNDARFMFQIPAGHPGLSDLYIVVYVKDGGKHQPAQYGHAATADKNTAQQWCETGVGFAPAMYTVTKGHVEVN
ncbi:hypothetical protein IPL85_00840 [Candidatus Saccharibacteria bacterium]|nr:MAG: hypothetical protein IPL85_00840 [Candidatus Saccharibacteria bacterium]